jgi:hypothetical protein
MDEGARRGDTRDGVNPYAVSQEERMRQYKERYANPKDRGEKKPEAAREGGRKPGARQAEGRKPDSRRPDIRQPRPQTEAGSQPKTPGRQQPAQGYKAPQAPQKAAPAKAGLLDRIKGLFGGKKRG